MRQGVLSGPGETIEAEGLTVPRFDDCLAFHWRPENDGQPMHDTPGDPGGDTAWGVTLSTYSAWRRQHGIRTTTPADLAAATKADLTELIHASYWMTVAGDEVGVGPDIMCFDFGYTAGPGNATRALQRALGIDVDGRLGPVTTATAAARAKTDKVGLVRRLAVEQMNYYRQCSDFAEFGHGWSNRTQARVAFALGTAPSAPPPTAAKAAVPVAANDSEPSFLDAVWEGLRGAV